MNNEDIYKSSCRIDNSDLNIINTLLRVPLYRVMVNKLVLQITTTVMSKVPYSCGLVLSCLSQYQGSSL